MYKCKECGAEFEEKPDYCDCGNDEFIQDKPAIEIKQTESIKKNISEYHAETDKKVENEPSHVKPAASNNFHNYNTYVSKRTVSVGPVSLVIFLICIILSIYVLFFAFNEVNNNQNKEIKNNTEPSVLQNIPSIDKIWNNAIPVIKTEEPKEEKKVENIIKQIIPVQTSKKTETKGKNVTKVPIKKTVFTQKMIPATKTTTVANTNKQTSVNAQEQAKIATETAAKQKAEQERKAAEAAQLKKLQEEQAKKLAEQKAKQAQLDKQEFINYKAQLRNTIARKIDFTHVIGDGSCTVAFKIDSNGKLTNRSFTKQSANNTLNDVVYAAVMSTPTFNPPPAAYNGEVLNLNIKFYNGNFEISLP